MVDREALGLGNSDESRQTQAQVPSRLNSHNSLCFNLERNQCNLLCELTCWIIPTRLSPRTKKSAHTTKKERWGHDTTSFPHHVGVVRGRHPRHGDPDRARQQHRHRRQQHGSRHRSWQSPRSR